MSQIPEAFQGHDLTGWVVIEDDRGQTLCRTTDYGSQIRLQRWDNHFGENESFEIYLDDICQDIKNAGLAEALAQAEAFSTLYPSRGWAPAPIGYERSGWQPDLLALLKQKCEELGGVRKLAQAMEVSPTYACQALLGNVKIGTKIRAYLGYESVTILRPLPASPEAKQ